jgi:hypothetical protein
MTSPHIRRGTGLALALALSASVATAQATPGAGSSGSSAHPSHAAPGNPCGYTSSKVFAPWHDNKSYVLTVNGGLEDGDTGWTLADGAAVAEGNESFAVGGATDHQSLTLPAGSQATSPANCVSRHTGTFRAFARTDGGPDARLKVEVVYLDGKGKKHSRVAGKLRAGDQWNPTKKLSVALGRAKGKGKMAMAHVAFRFTPIGAGSWQLDDVYLDPRARA